MNHNRLTSLSKFLSLVLRHKPEAANITVDEHGWASISDLINNNKNPRNKFTREIIEEIVKTDEKQRYSISPDGNFIRANQGHSFKVDLELKPQVPPPILYHGTATRFIDSIFKEGLKPMSRLQVHLSKDIETARKVGARHGKAAIIEIDTAKMQNAGYVFYISENGVWLTDKVPPEFMKVLE